ncbi:MAG: response regulator [Myxococcota bacterium]
MNPIPDDERAPELSGEPGRVLLAEDDAEMRLLLSAYLRRFGVTVSEAASGDELLAKLDGDGHGGGHGPPALVITDVHMPGMSGLEVLERFRRDDETTPVIVITSFGDASTHGRAKRLGAVRVFDKPFDLDDLVQEIEAILQD